MYVVDSLISSPIGELSVLRAHGCWLDVDCHIPLAEFSPLFWDGGLLPSFTMSWAIDLPWLWVASWMLRLWIFALIHCEFVVVDKP